MPPTTDPRRAHPLARLAVGVATMLVLSGLAVALFFNPAWVTFAQSRAGAAAATGWTEAEVREVTTDIVIEVWLGPGTFEQEVAGAPVFTAREREHMADVRRVVIAFAATVLVGALVLLAIGVASRGRRWWGAVGTGAKVLAVGTVVIGGAFYLVFDTAFTLFHELLFPAGSWSFDPATDRLVQLFPYQFWTETSVAIAIAALGLAIVTWVVARQLERRP